LDHLLTPNGEQEEEENQQRGEDKIYYTLCLVGSTEAAQEIDPNVTQ
jgi:hypothetical protein